MSKRIEATVRPGRNWFKQWQKKRHEAWKAQRTPHPPGVCLRCGDPVESGGLKVCAPCAETVNRLVKRGNKEPKLVTMRDIRVM